MLDPESLLRLYASVMHDDILENAIVASDIRAGVQCMANVYMKDADFQSSVLEYPNYNDVACRCAYLHKYAPLHTFIVTNSMLKILQKELSLFREVVENAQCFKLCSIGGGPGSDVIGVFSALKLAFSSFNASVTIVDCMEKWGITFNSVLQELKFGNYGTEWHDLAKNVQWNYIGANLLNSMTNEVNKSIASATFITMVKFVSASVCTNTEEMVDKIFRVMTPGALVLFIDNAAGGFTQIVERAGRKNGLVPIFGPLRHEAYEVEALKIDRFGYTSCFKTKVTIILLQKVPNCQKTSRYLNSFPNMIGQKTPVAKPLSSLDFVVLNDSSSKRKITNTINPPRPPEEINPPLAVVKPQTPVSNPAAGQKRIGVSDSSNSKSVRPSGRLAPNVNHLSTKENNTTRSLQKSNAVLKPQTPVSNPAVEQKRIRISDNSITISARSPEFFPPNMNDLSTKENNTTRSLQKSNETVGQTKRTVPTINPGSRSSAVNSSKVPQPGVRNNSIVPGEQRRPNVNVVSPKSPTKTAPASDGKSRPQTASSSTVRTYQPVPGSPQDSDQPLTEINDKYADTCCSCCVIS